MTPTYTSKLEKDGDDLVLPLPPEIVRALGVQPGTEVEVLWQIEAGTVRLKLKAE